jgi:molecular chaperone DnaK (HSP70)
VATVRISVVGGVIQVRVLGTDGDSHLGGRDYDQLIMDYVVNRCFTSDVR